MTPLLPAPKIAGLLPAPMDLTPVMRKRQGGKMVRTALWLRGVDVDKVVITKDQRIIAADFDFRINRDRALATRRAAVMAKQMASAGLVIVAQGVDLYEHSGMMFAGCKTPTVIAVLPQTFIQPIAQAA